MGKKKGIEEGDVFKGGSALEIKDRIERAEMWIYYK